MTLSFANLKELVLRKLQDDPTTTATNNVYTSAWIGSYLNAGVSDFILRMPAEMTKRTETTTNAPLVATALPSDYLGHLSIRFSRGTDQKTWLKQLSESELDRDNPNWSDETAADPSGYILNIGQTDGLAYYRLKPTLTAAVANGLLIKYAAKPTDMSLDADTPKALTFFPALQGRLLVHYALWQIMDFEGERKADRAAFYRGRYEEDIMEAKRTFSRMAINSGKWRP